MSNSYVSFRNLERIARLSNVRHRSRLYMASWEENYRASFDIFSLSPRFGRVPLDVTITNGRFVHLTG